MKKLVIKLERFIHTTVSLCITLYSLTMILFLTLKVVNFEIKHVTIHCAINFSSILHCIAQTFLGMGKTKKLKTKMVPNITVKILVKLEK